MTREERFKMDMIDEFKQMCEIVEKSGRIIENKYRMLKALEQVSEVTALAEWTEKLTKASEDAYNKGYADGVKSVNICPHCGEYIGEEE